MAKKRRVHLLSLPTQGVILLVIIVILTAGTIGFPAIWLLRGQLDRQAWEHVDQGNQMLKVLLDAQSNELSNLAILTAQRPTLSELLALRDWKRLLSYLETLRVGADLDLVAICDRQGNLVSQAGDSIPERVCEAVLSSEFYYSLVGDDISGWLLAYQPIPQKSTELVVVGQALDNGFSNQLSDQIGMEHLLLSDAELIGGSFSDNYQVWEEITDQLPSFRVPVSQAISESLTIHTTHYFAIFSPYGETGLETIVLLPGTVILETQQRLTRIAAVGILFVALFSSAIVILLTKWISLPLEHLRDSAIALRKGDLATPILSRTRVREIADVTYALEDARGALQHSLNQLRQEKAWGDYLLESVVEGIITIDRQSRITFFSQGAERITGWRSEQVLRNVIDDVFLLADRTVPFSQRIPSPGAKPEIVTILVDERPLTLAVSRARLAPPEVGKASLIVSIRDITNEEAMRGLLGDFLANITHEFRTPLTALAVSIELLLDQFSELSLDEIHELLVSNHLGVLSLQNLIDNLLEGASIEAGRFQVSPRPTELAEIVQEVARVMQPLMEKKHQSLRIDLPADLPLVFADPRRTNQVVVNLLSNAIKWGPQDSDIFLNLMVMGDEVRVSVVDQGPGIMPDHKQILFTRFGHVQSDDGRAECGAGLGLSVVKAIVESQKGQVGVEVRDGGGAIFWFTIPIVELSSSEDEYL